MARIILLLFITNSFGPHCVAHGILVPRLGIELSSPATETGNLNGWTARKVLTALFLKGEKVPLTRSTGAGLLH